MHHLPAQHNLPHHPLWEEGYVSIENHYLTAPLLPGMLGGIGKIANQYSYGSASQICARSTGAGT